MVPEFDQAVASLNVGQTSDIITTEFGYHLIQVQEKKAASPMSLDEIKDDLKEYLYQQRGAKRFDTYVKDLRTKADVKINSLD
jgi:parvulin-like peptidyl-prolyl isomerase